MAVLLVVTNLPDRAAAEQLAASLLEQRLAACVNILAPCQSLYRWRGKVETAAEIPVLIKSTTERYAAVESAIRSHHPYATPEIIAVPVTHGLPEYLHWVTSETCDEGQPPS